MPTRRAFALFLLVASAQANGQDALSAARGFLQARARKDWPAMVAYLDSAALAAIRSHADSAVELVRKYNVEAMRPQLAAAGVEAPLKLLEASREMFGGGSWLRISFAGITDTSVLKSLSNTDLAARWFEAKDPNYLARLLMDGMLSGILANAPDGGVQAREELEAEMRAPLDWTVLGALDEGSTPPQAHVTYRMTARGPTGVLTFRRVGPRWYLWLERMDQLDALAKLDLTARRGVRPPS